MRPQALASHPGLAFQPTVELALVKTMDALGGAFKGLPVPVRFRASGVLEAWIKVLDTVSGMTSLKTALSDQRLPPALVTGQFIAALTSQMQGALRSDVRQAQGVVAVARTAADMLCFWLRKGALYEPTLALSQLLGGVDVAMDLPLAMIESPTPALTILPPWQHRHQCANVQAIQVFLHDASASQAPALQCLTIKTSVIEADKSMLSEELTLPLKNQERTLAEAFDLAMSATAGQFEAVAMSNDDIHALAHQWRQVLDYTVKVLLYLQSEGSRVQSIAAYSDAPKQFPGLGRKKREAKLAEVNRLYDRYVVGPASAAEWAGPEASQLGAGGQLSPHWRRGHFRQQAHGPGLSRRRLMFIMPTLVRLDRLAGP